MDAAESAFVALPDLPLLLVLELLPAGDVVSVGQVGPAIPGIGCTRTKQFPSIQSVIEMAIMCTCRCVGAGGRWRLEKKYGGSADWTPRRTRSLTAASWRGCCASRPD